MLRRYETSDNPKIQELCIKALFNKGWFLGGTLYDYQNALKIYSALLTCYSNSGDPEIQVLCAMALFNEGCHWTRQGDFPAAISCYDKLLAQYSHIDNPNIQARCQRALANTAEWLLVTGQREAAIQRMQQALNRASEKDQESVIMRFLLWLTEAGTTSEEVLAAIHVLSPKVEFTSDFNNLRPLVDVLPEPRKSQAEYFLTFFKQYREAGYFRKLPFPSGGPNQDFPLG